MSKLEISGITFAEPVFDPRHRMGLVPSSVSRLMDRIAMASWAGSMFPGDWPARLAAQLALVALWEQAKPTSEYDRGFAEGLHEGLMAG